MTGEHLTNQEKLEEIYEMMKENNEILLGMRRQQHVANAFRILYWIVILASLGGVYYYLRPVLNTLNDNRTKVEDAILQFESMRSQLPEAKFLDQIINNLKGDSSVTDSTSEQQ